jgi:hypothetical protein
MTRVRAGHGSFVLGGGSRIRTLEDVRRQDLQTAARTTLGVGAYSGTPSAYPSSHPQNRGQDLRWGRLWAVSADPPTLNNKIQR